MEERLEQMTTAGTDLLELDYTLEEKKTQTEGKEISGQ